mmetsp:Transcript_106246/g.258145  ORF Transcript_106246/g.258145 Transcript_106246/m.258145 type:complete len:215 (+) Transcript_106246:409-1053(+)
MPPVPRGVRGSEGDDHVQGVPEELAQKKLPQKGGLGQPHVPGLFGGIRGREGDGHMQELPEAFTQKKLPQQGGLGQPQMPGLFGGAGELGVRGADAGVPGGGPAPPAAAGGDERGGASGLHRGQHPLPRPSALRRAPAPARPGQIRWRRREPRPLDVGWQLQVRLGRAAGGARPGGRGAGGRPAGLAVVPRDAFARPCVRQGGCQQIQGLGGPG